MANISKDFAGSSLLKGTSIILFNFTSFLIYLFIQCLFIFQAHDLFDQLHDINLAGTTPEFNMQVGGEDREGWQSPAICNVLGHSQN